MILCEAIVILKVSKIFPRKELFCIKMIPEMSGKYMKNKIKIYTK